MGIIRASTVAVLGVVLLAGCAPGQLTTTPSSTTTRAPAKAWVTLAEWNPELDAKCNALDAKKAARRADADRMNAQANQLMDDSFQMSDSLDSLIAQNKASALRTEAQYRRGYDEPMLALTCEHALLQANGISTFNLK